MGQIAGYTGEPGSNKPFGMTIAEWHLAAGAIDVGIAGATVFLMTAELALVPLSAVGASLVLAAGVATMVIGTLEALGFVVPSKDSSLVLEMVGGPFSVTGAVIGQGINGKEGLEAGIRLGQIFETLESYKEFSHDLSELKILSTYLNGANAIWSSFKLDLDQAPAGLASFLPASESPKVRSIDQTRSTVENRSEVKKALPASTRMTREILQAISISYLQLSGSDCQTMGTKWQRRLEDK